MSVPFQDINHVAGCELCSRASSEKDVWLHLVGCGRLNLASDQPWVAGLSACFLFPCVLKICCWDTYCRDKELAAVKVTAADVDIIMSELEVDHKQADRRLREHHGSVKAALQSFLEV